MTKDYFRPLSGSYISQYCMTYTTVQSISVSVPYRGATFLNRTFPSLGRHEDLFPSPIGELHFSICYKRSQRGLYRLFPSPIGELHFSIGITPECYHKFYQIVSVPYRGATFLNSVAGKTQAKMFPGFRPLSGSYISQ